MREVRGLDSPLERQQIPGIDGPAGNNPMNMALAAMVSSTAKPDDKKPRAIPEFSLPSDGDDDEPIRIETRAPRWQFDDLDRFNAENGGANSQVQEKVRLSGDNLEKYNEKRDIIRNKLVNSKKCRDFLISKQIDPDKALDALNSQRAFDGQRSTISRIAAGVVNPEVDLTTKSGYDFAYAPINLSFTNSRGAKIQAWTAFYSESRVFQTTVAGRSDVYFRESGINTGTILHEAIHSLTGLSDIKLAERLGVAVKDDDTNSISDVLKNNDCGN